MALIFCDGFDHYAKADFLKKWTEWSDTTDRMALSPTYKRTGTNALMLGGTAFGGATQQVGKTFSTGYTTMVLGMYIYLETRDGSVSRNDWLFYNNATLHVRVRWNNDKTVTIYRGTTALGTSPSILSNIGQGFYIEIKVVMGDNTAGSVTVRKNGNTFYELTGIDTINGGTGNINRVILENYLDYNNAGRVHFDDLYVDDADFLGDIKVETLYTSGAGTTTSWDSSSALTPVTDAVAWNAPGTIASTSAYSGYNTGGWRFTANANLTVTGLQGMAAYAGDLRMNLFRAADGVLLGYVTVTGIVGQWVSADLAVPIVLTSGTDYTIASNLQMGGANKYARNAPVSGEFNTSYITPVGGRIIAAANTNPTTSSTWYAGVDIIFDYTTANYARLNESPFNGDIDYISTAVAGEIDTYTFGNLATTAGTVYGVQTNIVARKDDAGSRSIAPVIRPASTDRVGTTVAISDTYMNYSQMHPLNPEDSGSWEIADVNGAEFGVKLIE